MSAFLELQKYGLKMDENMTDALAKHLTKSLNDDGLYRVIFDSRVIVRDILLNEEFTSAYFEKIGRAFVEAVAHEYIAANAIELDELDNPVMTSVEF